MPIVTPSGAQMAARRRRIVDDLSHDLAARYGDEDDSPFIHWVSVGLQYGPVYCVTLIRGELATARCTNLFTVSGPTAHSCVRRFRKRLMLLKEE